MTSPSLAGNEGTLVFDSLFAKVIQKYNATKMMSLLEMAKRQHTSTKRGKTTKVSTIPRLPSS